MSVSAFSGMSTDGKTVVIKPWPSEDALFAVIVITAICLWILLFVSVIGLIYALALGAFFFVSHLAFVAYLRGSAVRLGPDQFPELYNRVVELSNRAGLPVVPEVYLMQAGGTLNALATKLFRSDFIVLFSDLLEACGDNIEARDMIIAHELGHHKEHHLSLLWFLMPALFIPFLGSAYSRAREYTCDRYGYALAGGGERALRGLTILAAGAKHGPKVDLSAFVRQRDSLNTGLMTVGAWLSTHPPLSDRIAALEPNYATAGGRRPRGAARAVMLVFFGLVVPLVLAVFGIKAYIELIESMRAGAGGGTGYQMTISQEEAIERVNADLPELAAVIEEYRADNEGRLPPTPAEKSVAWEKYRPEKVEPWDPFDGYLYGYYISDDDSTQYVLWSPGPDLEAYTEDDIVYRSQNHAGQ